MNLDNGESATLNKGSSLSVLGSWDNWKKAIAMNHNSITGKFGEEYRRCPILCGR